jgi:uncharacterized membrane protein
MKRIMSKLGFAILAMLSSTLVWAQEKDIKVDIDVDKGDSNWYQQPWVWVVGAAVFIIIIVAILKGSGRKE